MMGGILMALDVGARRKAWFVAHAARWFMAHSVRRSQDLCILDQRLEAPRRGGPRAVGTGVKVYVFETHTEVSWALGSRGTIRSWFLDSGRRLYCKPTADSRKAGQQLSDSSVPPVRLSCPQTVNIPCAEVTCYPWRDHGWQSLTKNPNAE